MRPRLLACGALLALGACSFDSGGVGDDDGPLDAREPDAPPDAMCGGGAFEFDVANLDGCAIPLAAGNIVFPSGTVDIDTTTGVVIMPDGDFDGATALTTQADGITAIMVISGVDITIPADSVITVHGTRALAIVASGTLAISGTIDASAHLAASGPGANASCGAAAGADGVAQVAGNGFAGGSGGGGGAYATDGGTGSPVSPTNSTPTASVGGEQHTDEMLSPLVGGCHGGAGGIALASDVKASAGGAGGAVELVGGTAVILDGTVSVSGGGGSGAGATAAGGGGGGSGGAILIQSPSLGIDGAKLTANGGAGGEGRRDTGPGNPGQDGAITTATPAIGGFGVAGGNGGNGAVMMDDGKPAELGQGSTSATAGGGGGGGGMGRIHLRVRGNVQKQGVPIISPPETSSNL